MGGIVPDWIMEMSIGGAIATVAFAGAVVIGVVKSVRPLRRLFRGLDDMLGEPARPGHAARPGLMERLRAVEGMASAMSSQMTTIHHEVLPNAGESLRDEVTRNTEGIRAAHDRLDRLDKRLDDHIDGQSEQD